MPRGREGRARTRSTPGTAARVGITLALIALVLYTGYELARPHGCLVVYLKGPSVGGSSPRLAFDPATSVVIVEGGDRRGLEAAADRLALEVLAVPGANYTLNPRTDIRTYSVPVPVRTVDGGEAVVWFELRTNPASLGDVPVEGLGELRELLGGRPARFAFCIPQRSPGDGAPVTPGEEVLAATEVSRALGMRYPYLNTTDDITVHLSYEEALEVCR